MDDTRSETSKPTGNNETPGEVLLNWHQETMVGPDILLCRTAIALGHGLIFVVETCREDEMDDPEWEDQGGNMAFLRVSRRRTEAGMPAIADMVQDLRLETALTAPGAKDGRAVFESGSLTDIQAVLWLPDPWDAFSWALNVAESLHRDLSARLEASGQHLWRSVS